ncbi:PepSY domain-containing protein [Roseibium aggregatum]|uniref:PepSY domain-containing protein n=1 Tax=Roseibium aggregatum TaxID=187304 RepID=UPI00094AB65D|nr:PepSY domain-containing protein [Roseibium aggregatum]UFI06705.1 PepSY domain-containing protein [Roseibium aggregatum]UFI06863.1 PepSY domain-containing protein [Roseibium aggregatum]
MITKSMIALPVAMLGALPFAASAESIDATELAMFHGASVSLQQAADLAVKAHDGQLAAVTFGDEDGRAAYEAIVIGNDKEPWTVLVDAKSGEVFASAKSSDIKDHDDRGNAEDDDDEGQADGETNDD